MKNCVIGLKRDHDGRPRSTSITICMELLNSKVNHKDYMCDHTGWGVELVQEGRLADTSSCSTTSTTCRSWKAT